MSCVSRTLAQSWKDTVALCVCVTVNSTSRASELTSRLGVAAHRGSTCSGKRRAPSSIGSTSSWQPLHSHVGREFWLEHLRGIHELPSPRWEHPTPHGPPGRETFTTLLHQHGLTAYNTLSKRCGPFFLTTDVWNTFTHNFICDPSLLLGKVHRCHVLHRASIGRLRDPRQLHRCTSVAWVR